MKGRQYGVYMLLVGVPNSPKVSRRRASTRSYSFGLLGFGQGVKTCGSATSATRDRDSSLDQRQMGQGCREPRETFWMIYGVLRGAWSGLLGQSVELTGSKLEVQAPRGKLPRLNVDVAPHVGVSAIPSVNSEPRWAGHGSC